MGTIANTRDVLDAILDDTRRYKSKLDQVKAEAEPSCRNGTLREIQKPKDLQETIFMRGISTKQTEKKTFISNKVAETERLRQEVKHKKSATERAIKDFADELRRTRL